MNRTINIEDLKTMLEEKTDLTVLDVRRKADFDADEETVPGSAWRDPEKVGEWSQDLPQGKDVVIYCARGGSVSNKVLDHLLEKKIQARYLEGGITAWKEAGKKTSVKTPSK
jgi:rhodanese-related sulfurtransferase